MLRFLRAGGIAALLRDPDPAPAGGTGADPAHTEDPETCPCASCGAARLAKAKAAKARAAKADTEKPATMADVHAAEAAMHEHLRDLGLARRDEKTGAPVAVKPSRTGWIVAAVALVVLVAVAGVVLVLRKRPDLRARMAQVIQFPRRATA